MKPSHIYEFLSIGYDRIYCLTSLLLLLFLFLILTYLHLLTFAATFTIPFHKVLPASITATSINNKITSSVFWIQCEGKSEHQTSFENFPKWTKFSTFTTVAKLGLFNWQLCEVCFLQQLIYEGLVCYFFFLKNGEFNIWRSISEVCCLETWHDFHKISGSW